MNSLFLMDSQGKSQVKQEKNLIKLQICAKRELNAS